MNFVDMFNLKNTYYSFFGPLTFFTGSSANILLKEFERAYELVDGICISAAEFSGTSESINWGISASIWKAMGARPQYDDLGNRISYHKDIILTKKFLQPNGEVGTSDKVLYELPRVKLSDWAKADDSVFTFSKPIPIMTSCLTFKGSQPKEMVAKYAGKIDQNAMGTLMVGNTLTRSGDQAAVLSAPTTIQYVEIFEENFWRCVSSYAVRRVYEADWVVSKKELSAPNVNVEGYDIWLKNALVIFLFEYKSQMSSLRGVDFNGDKIDIYNPFFYLTEEEVREHCHDEKILADLDAHPLCNQFMLKCIRESEPYFYPEVKALYDWCKEWTLFTYDHRKEIDYRDNMVSADAGFVQIRYAFGMDDEMNQKLTDMWVAIRKVMVKDVCKFGFVSETYDEGAM